MPKKAVETPSVAAQLQETWAAPKANLMSTISRGKQSMPPRLMVYGTEGIGKSTLAANAPKPVFVQTEDGLNEIDCDKFALATNVDDVLAALDELARAEHDYQTVVVDSLDWLERLIWDAVCAKNNVDNVEDVPYAKGYVFSLTHWRKLLEKLDVLHSKGLAVILIAHAKVEKFEDPDSTSYDRYSPRLNKHASALLTEWSDAVLFATRKLRTQIEDKGFGRKRTIATTVGADGAERVLRTVGSPACVAKNRYSMPADIPLSWDALVSHIS